LDEIASQAARKSGVERWVDGLRSNENQLSLFLSLVMGALVGLVVVAFILLTGRLAVRTYPPGGAGWRRILVPTLGALATGYLLYRYFPNARGSGIPQTKFALFIQDGRIQLRTVLGKFFCCSASLASGIALGREGPSVQIGGGLASVIARRLNLSREQVKTLVPVGCSAALAAVFNTPIAAVLFSLEEIMGDLHPPVLGSVVLSSVTAWMVRIWCSATTRSSTWPAIAWYIRWSLRSTPCWEWSADWAPFASSNFCSPCDGGSSACPDPPFGFSPSLAA
jgi:H+/Cl- antiporter ClcA